MRHRRAAGSSTTTVAVVPMACSDRTAGRGRSRHRAAHDCPEVVEAAGAVVVVVVGAAVVAVVDAAEVEPDDAAAGVVSVVAVVPVVDVDVEVEEPVVAVDAWWVVAPGNGHADAGRRHGGGQAHGHRRASDADQGGVP